MDKNKMAVIIPAYNEEGQVGNVIKGIRKLDKNCEIVVVDDASTDNTGKIAKEQQRVKVITHSYNKGYGGSIKSGLRAADSEIVGIIDGDGQHKPEDLFKLHSLINDYDMVVGARTLKEQFVGLRGVGRKFLRFIASYLVGVKIQDLNCGLRVMRKKRILEFMHILPNGFSFSTTLTLALLKNRYDVYFMPITTYSRLAGKSSVNLFKDGLQTLLLIIRIVVLFNPLKIFIPISIILFVTGFLYTLFTLIFIKFHIPSGAVLLFISSLIIFFFGILADQISAVRQERE